jgi:hypothetical protein
MTSLILSQYVDFNAYLIASHDSLDTAKAYQGMLRHLVRNASTLGLGDWRRSWPRIFGSELHSINA